MALDPYTDGFIDPVPLPHHLRDPDVSRYLETLVTTINLIAVMTPQAADQEPENPLEGMQRLAIPPWDPLTLGAVKQKVIYINGAWAAL